MNAPDHLNEATAPLARPGVDALAAMLYDAPFVELLRGPWPPVIAACGAPPRVVWATPQALDFFAADSLEDLSTRLFEASAAGSARLASLALTLPTSAKPRLERLRFSASPLGGQITCLVRSYSSASGGALFAMAVLGVKPAADVSGAAARTAISDERAFAPLTQAAPTNERRSFADTATDLAARFGGRKAIRFIWQTNARHELTAIDPEAAEFLGDSAGLGAGANLAAFFAADDCDPTGAARLALGSRMSWSGVTTFWPARGGSARAPVKLGATPLHDRDRQFAGYRGYGVILLDQLAETARDAASKHEEKHEASQRSALEKILPINLRAAPQQAAPEPVMDEPVMDSAATAQTAPAAPADLNDYAAANAAENDREATPAAAHAEPAEPLAPTILFAVPGAPAAPTTPLLVPTAPGFVLLRATARLIPASEAGQNVVQLRPAGAATPPTRPVLRAVPQTERPTVSDESAASLSSVERNAFREIARALGARIQDERDGLAERGGAPAPLEPVHKPAPVAPAPASPTEPEATLSAYAPDFENESLQRNARQLFDRLPVGVIVCRSEAVIYANRTLLDLLGFDSADAFYASGGVGRMFRGRQPEALDPGAQGGAVPIIGADGEVMSVDARLQTISWDGLPATLISFRRAAEPETMPQLRAAELELRQREGELREVNAILDTATDGVAVIDEHGRLLSMNRSAQALFGYDQNEVAGENISMLFAQPSHGLVQDYFARIKGERETNALNDGREVIGREVLGRERQGGPIPLFLTMGRVGGAGGKYCAVLRDLTQSRHTERELGEARKQAEKASALKSDFLAKVSHEIRTPLNSILGFAEVMIDERLGVIGNDRYKGYLKDIHASGAHVLSLVNDLLDLSKIEAGKSEMKFVAVDANRIVSECVSLMQPQAAKVRVIMRLSLTPRLPSIVADERSLRQIALNLLSNAVKFTEPGGQVIVSTAITESGAAVVRVKDTGIGMSEEDIGIALEPFRQVSTSRNTRGTGLGLPLTKALIEANRASFSIKSRRNEGTLVEVIFPATRVLAE